MSNGVQSNYMSDAAILAWVASQQETQYGQLRGAMDFETTRGEMLQDVAVIRDELSKAAKSTDGMPQLNEDVKAFIAKYDGIPEFKDLVDAVKDFADDTQSKAEQMDRLTERQEGWDALPVPGPGEEDTRPLRPTGPETFDNQEVGDWRESLSSLSDNASHNEQLAMIRINEIKSNIDHSADLASQLIKSSNDTTDTAIRNIV